jgi:hypothetical protein
LLLKRPPCSWGTVDAAMASVCAELANPQWCRLDVVWNSLCSQIQGSGRGPIIGDLPTPHHSVWNRKQINLMARRSKTGLFAVVFPESGRTFRTSPGSAGPWSRPLTRVRPRLPVPSRDHPHGGRQPWRGWLRPPPLPRSTAELRRHASPDRSEVSNNPANVFPSDAPTSIGPAREDRQGPCAKQGRGASGAGGRPGSRRCPAVR